MTLQSVQRVRVVFRVGPSVKYISHLDLMRAWERALRRAKVSVAYSAGFNPRPKLVFAAALPVGFTARAEVVDISLEQPMDLRRFADLVKAQLPSGLEIVDVSDVSAALPSLPSQVSAAEYRVTVETEESLAQVQVRLGQLLATDTLPRVRKRPGGAREYDLRPLVHKLWLVESQGAAVVMGMLLQANAQGTGRPEEVLAALGMGGAARAVERVGLLFATR